MHLRQRRVGHHDPCWITISYDALLSWAFKYSLSIASVTLSATFKLVVKKTRHHPQGGRGHNFSANKSSSREWRDKIFFCSCFSSVSSSPPPRTKASNHSNVHQAWSAGQFRQGLEVATSKCDEKLCLQPLLLLGNRSRPKMWRKKHSNSECGWWSEDETVNTNRQKSSKKTPQFTASRNGEYKKVLRFFFRLVLSGRNGFPVLLARSPPCWQADTCHVVKGELNMNHVFCSMVLHYFGWCTQSSCSVCREGCFQ